MKTQNRQYELPNQFHDVVEDINSLRETFGAIDADIKNCEIQNAALEETAENLENKLFHVDSSLANTEIQSIAPNRFLISNATATGFECVDGSIAILCMMRRWGRKILILQCLRAKKRRSALRFASTAAASG